MKNIDIYFSRLISALCLFLILAEANVWLNPVNNTILVLGYRLFILFTPILFLCFHHRLTFFAYILTEIGIVFWLAHYTAVGVIFFAIGISVSGYMLKYYSAFSTKGSAGNKIALSLGSTISGLLVLVTQDAEVLLIFSLLAIFISGISFVSYYRREPVATCEMKAAHFSLRGLFSTQGLAWALIGIVIGVKLISLVSVLPQFIMAQHQGQLPSWYGAMLILNSVIIIFFQIPIMNKIKKYNKSIATIPLFLAILVITFSAYFGISSGYGAFVWVVILSLIECAISYLDKLSQDDGLLLIKESAVGLGSAATVFCMRIMDPAEGAYVIGIISLILLTASILLFQTDNGWRAVGIRNVNREA